MRTRLCRQVPGVHDGNLPAVPALQTHAGASRRTPAPCPLLAPLLAAVLSATQDGLSPRGPVLGEAAQWGCGTWERGGAALTHPLPHPVQVLVLEMNKVLLPARLEIQGTDPVSAVTLSLLEPEPQVKSLLGIPSPNHSLSPPAPPSDPASSARTFPPAGPSQWLPSAGSGERRDLGQGSRKGGAA